MNEKNKQTDAAHGLHDTVSASLLIPNTSAEAPKHTRIEWPEIKNLLLSKTGNLGAKKDKAGDVYVFKTCDLGNDHLKTDWFFVGTIGDIRALLENEADQAAIARAEGRAS